MPPYTPSVTEWRPPAESPETSRARRIRLWIGFGVPAGVAGIVAMLLGIPWWIIAIVLALLVVGMVFNT